MNKNENIEMIAHTFFGLEEVLKKELLDLGAINPTILNNAVSFKGDKKILYKTNLWLRSALKILIPMYKFTATTPEMLYDKAIDYPWDKYLNLDETFSIESVVNSKYFNHSKYAALKLKDAIADYFNRKFKKRPSVDTKSPHLALHLYISDENCSIAINSSGQSLHRRGYREYGSKAPLNEALAAGLILASGWNKDCDFLDPMCGSGTIAIEAAMIANNIAPRLDNSKYNFLKWRNFDRDIWKKLLDEAKKSRSTFKHKIYAADNDSKSIYVSRQNIIRAKLQDKIIINKIAFEDSKAKSDKGMIVMNPPYGERIEVDDLLKLYKDIGTTLKNNYNGYTAYIISPNLDAIKSIGLRSSQKMTIFNGPLKCKYLRYDSYKGSKKDNSL